VTQKSIVLLKNDGNLLPLDKTTVKSLAVIGPNADVDISDWYGGKPPYTVTARAGITAAVGTGRERAVCLGQYRWRGGEYRDPARMRPLWWSGTTRRAATPTSW